MSGGRKTVLICLTLFCLAFASYLYLRLSEPASLIVNYPSQNSGLVAFGDSLVFGVGSTRGGGFVKMLSEELQVPIVNLGKSGDTTSDALKRASEVAARKPAVVIVLLGGNDFLRGIPAEETMNNLGMIIKSIQLSGSVVLLVGLESAVPGRGDNERFQSLADRYGTAYVPDILEDIFGHPTYLSDDIHPNDLGYRLMAERIKPVLKKLME